MKWIYNPKTSWAFGPKTRTGTRRSRPCPVCEAKPFMSCTAIKNGWGVPEARKEMHRER